MKEMNLLNRRHKDGEDVLQDSVKKLVLRVYNKTMYLKLLAKTYVYT